MHEIILPYEKVKWLKLGQMAKICDMHKSTHVFQGQMAKICKMHKITHAFECDTHVNIMGPNK
jgi:hypothetical protein